MEKNTYSRIRSMFPCIFSTISTEIAVILINGIILALILIKIYHTRKNKVPPGPWGLPYFGYWPFLQGNNTHIQLTELKEKYGDVFSFTITGRLYIHLGTRGAIREAHTVKGYCFKGRCMDFGVLHYVFDKGISWQNGEHWKELRKYFIKIFKDWGITSRNHSSDETIYQTIKRTMESFNSQHPVCLESVLKDNISEIIRLLIFGNDGLSVKEMKTLYAAFEPIHDLINKSQLLIGNVAKYIIFPMIPGVYTAMKNHQFIIRTLEEIIKSHEKTYDENNIRNVIDSFLKEKNERKKRKDSTAKYFTVDCLAYTLLQFLGDGVLDVAHFIGYFFTALVEHEVEQEKIYQELVDIIGTDRQPLMKDKSLCTYTNAFINEVVRISDFFPLFPTLECTTQTTINGYRIPKGSILLTNMWAAQHDATTFEDPYHFNPSRYLKHSGKEKAPSSVNFGVGKRACIGESFSMNLMFLFVATTVYNFKLKSGKDISEEKSDNMNIIFQPRI